MKVKVKDNVDDKIFWTEIGEVIDVPDDFRDRAGNKWDVWVKFPNVDELIPFSWTEIEIV